MAAPLRAVPNLPLSLTLPSMVMPQHELRIHRLGNDTSPLSTEDRMMLINTHFFPNKEVLVTNYRLPSPTCYVVVAIRRCPPWGPRHV